MQEFSEKTDKEFIQWLEYQWNIELNCVRRDVDIQGSPERALSRGVLQAQDSNLYLLEKFPENKFHIRDKVAKAIEILNANGLKQALMYKKSKNGEFLPSFRDACFQLSPFLNSTGLKRPDYLQSAVMGKSFAEFLIQMSWSAVNMEKIHFFKPFSIKAYIYKLFGEMKIYDTMAYKIFSPVLAFLENNFLRLHDTLPVCFCHGDLHPLNVIWDNDHIRGVIDWEFAGMKPDIYDAANLVGCAGIENPEGLGMPMVMTFLEELRGKKVFSEAGWRLFPEYVLALRFAWLAEWLRKKDEHMIEMEAAYMKILMNHMDVLRQNWGI